jgi:hypothetical protein
MDISRVFLLLGYVRLEVQPFKLEVEKIVPQLLGEDLMFCIATLWSLKQLSSTVKPEFYVSEGTI